MLLVGGLALVEKTLPLLLKPADLLLQPVLLQVQVPDGRLVGHLGGLEGANLTWKPIKTRLLQLFSRLTHMRIKQSINRTSVVINSLNFTGKPLNLTWLCREFDITVVFLLRQQFHQPRLQLYPENIPLLLKLVENRYNNVYL